ncbi:hypothetical protein Barb6_03611 [Bacteroidales bacterium Barb6]|nr:hypothetical protein Barb6_03611 [Bacteroidales bacterium Barb6]
MMSLTKFRNDLLIAFCCWPFLIIHMTNTSDIFLVHVQHGH